MFYNRLARATSGFYADSGDSSNGCDRFAPRSRRHLHAALSISDRSRDNAVPGAPARWRQPEWVPELAMTASRHHRVVAARSFVGTGNATVLSAAGCENLEEGEREDSED